MRFLHSIPLPLLLILSSFVSFDLQAVPFDSNQQPRRLIRSANDIGPNNLSYVFENYDKLAEQYRRKNSAVTVKPLSLENEGSSEPSVTDNYNELSADELMTKWELEEQNLRQLNETIDAENEKLEQKMKDAAGPFEDYDKAKAEWQRLDGVFNEKNKGKLELEYVKGNATKKYDKAKKAYEDMDKIVKEQEKIEAKLEEAKKGADDVEHFATYLPQETAKAEALSKTEIPKQKKLVASLVDPMTTATGARNFAKTEFEGLKMLDARCKTSTDQTNCPTIENINAANQTLRDREGELFTATENHRLASENLIELQEEEKRVNARVELLKDYEERFTTFRDLFDGDVEKYKKKQKEFGKTLDEARVLNASLYDAYALATATMTGAENDLNNYPSNDIDAAKNEASMAFSAFLINERIRNPLHDELDKMKKHLKELEKERDQSNQRVSALKQVYQAKSRKDEPDTGSSLTIPLAVAGALVLLAVLAVVVVKFVVMPWRKNRRQPQTAQEPSAIKDETHEPLLSKSGPGESGMVPGSNKDIPTTTKSSEAQPLLAAGKSNDAAPALEGHFKHVMPFVRSLDLSKFLPFEEFLDGEPEKIKPELTALVKPGSKVYFKNGVSIFNSDDDSGNILIIYKREYVLYMQDARRFQFHVTDYNNPLPFRCPIPKNPTPGRVHFAARRNFFHIVKNMFRRNDQETKEHKAETADAMKKWVQCIRKADHRWGKENPHPPPEKRSAAGREGEDITVEDMAEEVMKHHAGEYLELVKALDPDEQERHWRELKHDFGELMTAQNSQAGVTIEELPASEDEAERSSGGGDSEKEEKRDSDKKSDHSDKKSDRKSHRKPKPSRQKKKGRGKKSPKAGKHGKNKNQKDGSSSSTESDPKPPGKDPSKVAEEAHDEYKGHVLEGEKVFTLDGFQPHLDRFKKNADDKPRTMTVAACDKMWRKILNSAKIGQKELMHDFDTVVDICVKFKEVIANDPKIIWIDDNAKTSKNHGDLHGNIDDLYNFMTQDAKEIGSKEWLEYTYIFTGDYVDRGTRSLDLVLLLFCLRICYPKNIILLRGNHECYETNISYGFKRECMDRVRDKEGTPKGSEGLAAHYFLNYTFGFMSIACVYNKFLHVHGCIPRKVLWDKYSTLDELNRSIPDFMWEPRRVCFMVFEMLWNDPVTGDFWCIYAGARGAYQIGKKTIDAFLAFVIFQMILAIIRAHQMTHNGYEPIHQCLVICVFSATNYEPSYPNHGAAMYHTPDHVVYFGILVARDKSIGIRSLEGGPLDDETKALIIDKHNSNCLQPSLKVENVQAALKPGETDSPSETARG